MARQDQSGNQKDGVWTHRYTVGEVRSALHRANERNRPYFRSDGRLQDTGEISPPKKSK